MNGERTHTIVLIAAALMFAAWGGAEAARGKRKPSVSKKVADAVKAQFPNGEITRAMRQKRAVIVYQLAVADGEDTVDMAVTEDGQIVDVVCKIDPKHMPGPVAKMAAEKSGGAEITEAVCKDTRAEAMVVKLRKPQITYEVKFHDGKDEVTLTIDRNGKVLMTDITQ